MLYSTRYESPLGSCLIVADEQNLVGLWLEGQKYYYPSDETLQEDDNNIVLKKTKLWLEHYFAGCNPSISEIPLNPIGSDFRQDVWEILKTIPYGEVMTYGDIAKMIAKKHNKDKMSAQAVGGAVGHNPISIIVPCHRVIGRNGNLTGYAGGIQKKIWLLQHEGVDVSKMYYR